MVIFTDIFIHLANSSDLLKSAYLQFISMESNSTDQMSFVEDETEEYPSSSTDQINHGKSIGQALFMAGSYSPPQTWIQPEDISVELPRSTAMTTPDRQIAPPPAKPTLLRTYQHNTSRKKLSSTNLVKTSGLSGDKNVNKRSVNKHLLRSPLSQRREMVLDSSQLQLPPPQLDTIPEDLIFSILGDF